MAPGQRRPLAGCGDALNSTTAFRVGVHGKTSNYDNARVAQRSAQLIAEGLTDYRAAKLKAARQLV